MFLCQEDQKFNRNVRITLAVRSIKPWFALTEPILETDTSIHTCTVARISASYNICDKTKPVNTKTSEKGFPDFTISRKTNFYGRMWLDAILDSNSKVEFFKKVISIVCFFLVFLNMISVTYFHICLQRNRDHIRKILPHSCHPYIRHVRNPDRPLEKKTSSRIICLWHCLLDFFETYVVVL